MAPSMFIEVNLQGGENTLYLPIFIFTIAIVWCSLVVFSYYRYGWKKTIRYFIPMIIAALLIEAAGVASGRYIYPGYLLYISVVGGAVPIIIVLAWSANLFLFLHMGKQVVLKFYSKHNTLQIFLISLLAGFFAVCLDLLEDPLAHHNNWWVWKGSLAGIKFFDVPLINFIGWFFLIFFMTLATILIDRMKISENRKILISISSLSITGIAIFVTHGLILRLLQFVGLAG